MNIHAVPMHGVTLEDMAPTPKPAALKLLNGRGPGKDSAGRPVVDVPHDRTPPRMPNVIREDPVAEEEWNRVVPGLNRLKILKPEDMATMTAYCLTWSQYLDAKAQVDREGITIYVTVKGSGGETTRKPIANPAYKVMAERQTALLRFAKEFGLTPASEAAAWNGKDDTSKADTTNPFAAGSTG
jgi:P27 family predicted phage terminase small subunit